MMMEVSGDGYSTFNFSYENYASTEMGQGSTQVPYVTSFSATQWDAFTWDSFIWDGVTLAPSEVEIVGTAENLSLMFLSSSDY